MSIDGTGDRVVPTSTTRTGNWQPSGYPYDWSPDSRRVLIDQYPGQLTVVDVASGESWPIEGITDTDRDGWAGMQWAPDGSFVLASGGGDESRVLLTWDGVTYDAVRAAASAGR